MNEALNNLLTRRSCRAYKEEQIKTEELDAILEAGTFAPTGRGLQSPLIVAVQNPETVAKIEKLNATVIGNPDAHTFYGAPTVVVVFADSESPLGVSDANLVIGNMLNAAYALGLGGRWINRAEGMLEDDLGKELLKEAGYEGEYVGVGNVILGYPANGFPAPIEHKKDYYRIMIIFLLE